MKENPYEYGDVRPDADADPTASNTVDPPPAEEEGGAASEDVETKEEETKEQSPLQELVEAAKAVYDRFPNAHGEPHMKRLRELLEKHQ